jgi:hypothetical protein
VITLPLTLAVTVPVGEPFPTCGTTVRVRFKVPLVFVGVNTNLVVVGIVLTGAPPFCPNISAGKVKQVAASK